MSLPIKTRVGDIEKICNYLLGKPVGTTMSEARAVLDNNTLDGRKLAALKFWGLIEENADKMQLTDLGREAARDKGAGLSNVLREVIKNIPPYKATVEWAVHNENFSPSSNDVAAHWHKHFENEVSGKERTLNNQVLCFFQIAEGAGLGKLFFGRRTQPTRFEFDKNTAHKFVEGEELNSTDKSNGETRSDHTKDKETTLPAEAISESASQTREDKEAVNRSSQVFITHGKNETILKQVQEIVTYGKFKPVVAQEQESTAKPVPDKVLDDMRKCKAAVIHVDADRTLFDEKGEQVVQINENVLIEIGAALALYGRNFIILLVEKGIDLPSNLQGLYECRYSGDELDMQATMKLLKAFNDFMD